MSRHVVVGAGATARATALLLAEEGVSVTQVSRRGGGADHPLVERVAADAGDSGLLAELATGAETLINCAIPAYDRWVAEVPPFAASLLAAVERTGVGYVMLGNLYGYGHVDGPITEDLPMAPVSAKGRARAQMWLDALAATEAGRVRATEVRAAAFLGRGAVSTFTLGIARQVLAGEVATYPGRLDVPQCWSDVQDVARTLVAAARDDRSWGRAWHAPATANIPVGELTRRFAELTGAPEPRLERLDREALAGLAADSPILGELVEMLYATENPHILDSTGTERALGLTATPLDQVLLATADGLDGSDRT
ncbi:MULTISPECIES: NAD-dependent epimerase/dehydratase family protein [Streptacidiphilus]|uniref:NAD-dependent epimerase/dehydratase family protein n=1 Tax=Streptacidiphilus cavernicola TaxID=3342716 RepID=A0ABV6UFW6_9ACTN|nr:NAD-dependent epimerase/dehydratase family protein [Streptacidiphilus jeojiense]